MSSIYHTEPATSGKVLLHTTYGDIDVELWSKECPLACRNFIQLALEGYYDNSIFHRIVKNFMIQGGDPTGSGNGGESIYNGPFKDETHSRIRFNHRGQLAMANENKPNSNYSQFFITFDSCEYLQGKHTIFGKVTGNTIFNVLRMNDIETDSQDRPLEPPRLLSIEILWNPYDDIIPRDNSLIKKNITQQNNNKNNNKIRAVKKDKKLLSFQDEEDNEENNSSTNFVGIKSIFDINSSNQNTLTDNIQNNKLNNENESKDNFKTIISNKLNNSINKSVDENEIENSEKNIFEEKMKQQILERKERFNVKKYDENTISDNTISNNLKSDNSSNNNNNINSSNNISNNNNNINSSSNISNISNNNNTKRKLDPSINASKLLEEKRQKYSQKRVNLEDRQLQTYEKFLEFSKSIKTQKQQLQSTNTIVESKIEESYHGQILENDTNDNDANWFTNKLKFKRHIDDELRSQTVRK